MKSKVYSTLIYPIVAFAVMLLSFSISNPHALPVGLLWFGPLASVDGQSIHEFAHINASGTANTTVFRVAVS